MKIKKTLSLEKQNYKKVKLKNHKYNLIKIINILNA